MSSLFLCVLIFALPFGTRKLLYQFTPGFHQYEAVFLYATDFLLAAFLATVIAKPLLRLRQSHNNVRLLPRQLADRNDISINAKVFFLVFVALAGISIFFAPVKLLALYSFARLLLVAAFAAATAHMLRRGVVRFRSVCVAVAVSAVFQSLVAFAQFVKQGSVGLRLLGEPILSANAPGIAKFAAEGGKILRAYGTFPHPNVLGAFLMLGLLALCYLWLRNTKELRTHENREGRHCEEADSHRPTRQSRNNVRLLRHARNDGIYIAGLYIVLLGLILTFSRSAWIVAVISSVALLLYCFARKALRRRALFLFFLLFAISAALFAVLRPFILPRAKVIADEPAVTQRLAYNVLGFELIREHPFGVGIGNQVLYAAQNGLYQKFGMDKVWQWEPIHNIYLLIGAEIGVLGLLAFMALNVTLIADGLWQIVRPRPYAISYTPYAVIIMLSALLLLGFADHYLWTLWPGQLMLWLAIGLVWGAAGRSR